MRVVASISGLFNMVGLQDYGDKTDVEPISSLNKLFYDNLIDKTDNKISVEDSTPLQFFISLYKLLLWTILIKTKQASQADKQFLEVQNFL